MERSELESRIKKVICQVLDISEDMIAMDNHFVFDLGAESTQSVELVAAFEAEFDIEMDDDSALAVDTVGGAVEYIGKYV
ncbi:MAG: acyl carrier protein [Pirellulales bacterium]|nr:acyl carrier protein [Pirellulales bacterium]